MRIYSIVLGFVGVIIAGDIVSANVPRGGNRDVEKTCNDLSGFCNGHATQGTPGHAHCMKINAMSCNEIRVGKSR